MAMSGGKDDGSPMMEMNMTPLIDVMLVLLVIFIITAPLIGSSLKLDLPKSEAGSANDAPRFVALSIDAQGRLFLGEARSVLARAEAAELAREATTACTPQGRALYAGHAALPWPDAPHLVLWHAITLLREYRERLAERTGVTVCLAVICEALKRLKLRPKKRPFGRPSRSGPRLPLSARLTASR